MGTEHDTKKLKCGCIKNHTYDTYCGIALIDGTDRYWIDYCKFHGGVLPTTIVMPSYISAPIVSVYPIANAHFQEPTMIKVDNLKIIISKLKNALTHCEEELTALTRLPDIIISSKSSNKRDRNNK
jgi:hypothetical protein